MVDEVLKVLVGTALGGLVGFSSAMLAFGSRLTRIETKVEKIEEELRGMKNAALQLAGRRHWPLMGES